MDNKKAIRELEILKEDYWDDDGYGHETKQYDDTMLAIDMAIESLENQESEKERIVKELEEKLEQSYYNGTSRRNGKSIAYGMSIAYQEAIEIVKRGGVSGKDSM